ncbi:conserved hypothetical protein [Verticillium alfalfae VaMs.102]|uniref:Retinol dehydrogenase n=1 Tax=Verticillium alfalfae (strain VaMs.102 / ATCC MYA-4576 / FGSC 10136) TaxID=526221 RepID=C9S6S4_VERA1|nr:conserved hypothetical protein [Verticillium alfalfae VaMs.102]EEY15177.1 conserved hypothetical protein [Verticillium alfalfae VaMs.102]
MAGLIREAYSQFKDLPVPDTLQTGRTIIITGANVGFGLEAARHFTRLHADRVIIACRDKTKGDTAADWIRASFPDSPTKLNVWLVDISDFASIKAFAARAEKELNRVDVFLSSQYRDVDAYFNERKQEKIFDALNANRSLLDRYNVSKLLQVIIVKQLATATRVPGYPPNERIIINTLHPGLCQTELFRSMPFPLNYPLKLGMRVFGRTSEVGSRCLLAGALAGEESHGRYMENCVVAEYAPILNGEEGELMQVRVWEEVVAILESIQPGITKLI